MIAAELPGITPDDIRAALLRYVLLKGATPWRTVYHAECEARGIPPAGHNMPPAWQDRLSGLNARAQEDASP